MTTDRQITDAERAFRMKDYEMKVGYLTGQFTRMWQRFAFFVTLQAALLAANTASWDKPRRILVLAIAGAVLSVVWFIVGAEDRYLVFVYRLQVESAGKTLAECVPLEVVKEDRYEPVGHLDHFSQSTKVQLKRRKHWAKLIEWRWTPISITHMPAWLSLLGLIGWLSVLMMHFKSN